MKNIMNLYVHMH